MRTPWEQARQEAFTSAVKRGQSRLLGEEKYQTAEEPSLSPSAAQQAATLLAQVAARVKDLVPAATQEEIAKTAIGRIVPMLQNNMLIQPTAPSSSGMSSSTKKALVVGVGALAGAGLLFFLLRKKQA